MAKLKKPAMVLALHEMDPESAEDIGHPDEGLIKVTAGSVVQDD